MSFDGIVAAVTANVEIKYQNLTEQRTDDSAVCSAEKGT
jgi:hypothetical protein